MINKTLLVMKKRLLIILQAIVAGGAEITIIREQMYCLKTSTCLIANLSSNTANSKLGCAHACLQHDNRCTGFRYNSASANKPCILYEGDSYGTCDGSTYMYMYMYILCDMFNIPGESFLIML